MRDPDETKFGKSRRNKGTENAARDVVLLDRRFRVVDLQTKRRLLELLAPPGNYGTQTFDLVMGNEDGPTPTSSNVDSLAQGLRLIEMKATRKRIPDQALAGFFFGATEREYEMARVLGDRYLFAFVVLNGDNVHRRPFFVLLTLVELEARTQSRRVQYQVNLRTRDLPTGETRFGIGPAGFVDRANSAAGQSLWSRTDDGQ